MIFLCDMAGERVENVKTESDQNAACGGVAKQALSRSQRVLTFSIRSSAITRTTATSCLSLT